MPKYTKDMWSQWKDYRVGEVNDELTESIKKQNEEQEKAQGRSQMGDGKIHRPNINPSSTYNY